jgi:hypothetical protein
MNIMKDLWLKVGCFLTGYNYQIVKSCSEVTAKEVKRYTSALLIICILWAFIGYTFAKRYIQAGQLGSIVGAVILVVIIIQIERQIILSINPTKKLYTARAVIAVMMSLIGSIIIDQMILKEDIEHKKMLIIDEKVNKILPFKTADLRQQIAQLDSTIIAKEIIRDSLQTTVSKNPTIKAVSVNSLPVVVSSTVLDSNKIQKTTQRIVNSSAVSTSSIPNPNIALIQQMDIIITQLRQQKGEKDSALLTLRPALEKQLLNQKGFLDEMNVMYRLISESRIAFFVWLLWVIIILGIELFVLISKAGEKTNDYQAMIKHQMDTHLHKLNLLHPIANK